jgi:hypothetical protein
MSNTTGSYTAGEINLENLPDEMLVSVKAKTLKSKLEWLMFQIGQYGFPVFVKYDPVRDSDGFTVMVGKYPRTDTDNPAQVLEEILEKKKGSEEK